MALLLLLVGAVSGTAGVLVHARWWGLPLVLAALVATMLALPAGWSTRLAFSLGWVVALGYALLPRAEGDFLLASTTGSYLFLGTGVVVLIWAIATMPRPSSEAARSRARGGDDHGEVGSPS